MSLLRAPTVLWPQCSGLHDRCPHCLRATIQAVRDERDDQADMVRGLLTVLWRVYEHLDEGHYGQAVLFLRDVVAAGVKAPD